MSVAASLAMLAWMGRSIVTGQIPFTGDLLHFHYPLRDFYAAPLAAGQPFDWMPGLFSRLLRGGGGAAGRLSPAALAAVSRAAAGSRVRDRAGARLSVPVGRHVAVAAPAVRRRHRRRSARWPPRSAASRWSTACTRTWWACWRTCRGCSGCSTAWPRGRPAAWRSDAGHGAHRAAARIPAAARPSAVGVVHRAHLRRLCRASDAPRAAPARWRVGVTLAAGALLGLAVGAVQVLATLDAAAHSTRPAFDVPTSPPSTPCGRSICCSSSTPISSGDAWRAGTRWRRPATSSASTAAASR